LQFQSCGIDADRMAAVVDGRDDDCLGRADGESEDGIRQLHLNLSSAVPTPAVDLPAQGGTGKEDGEASDDRAVESESVHWPEST